MPAYLVYSMPRSDVARVGLPTELVQQRGTVAVCWSNLLPRSTQDSMVYSWWTSKLTRGPWPTVVIYCHSVALPPTRTCDLHFGVE